MNVLLVLFACIIVVCSGAGFTFTGNLSAQDIKNNKWDYKYTSSSTVNLGTLYSGANFQAGEFTGTITSGDIDITVGSAYIVLGAFPFAYLAYFKGSYNISLDGQAFASADMSASAGYVGNAALWLEERDPNNTLVATRSLESKLNIGTDDGMTYSLSESSQPTDAVQYVTFTGASNDESASNFGVKITYLASRVAGILAGDGVKDVPVVPGSVESIFTINNYPYKSLQNKVSLVLAVATGSADVSASGRTVQDSNKQVYFSVSENALIGGNQASVSISGFETGSFSDVGNSNFQDQVTQKYGAKAAIKLVKVTFPAGAANIVYDPSLGTGVSVQDSHQGSSSFAPSFVAPLLSLVLLMFAFVLL
eukprot:Phypoly_transcript_09771.p1 GENE.Phypoly_transcript_09771~~Phypoly_transcript_09771.p1  ORF type:complete len:365 (+),score=69.72 Phypoly_transcript_09771:198-1292(+)